MGGSRNQNNTQQKDPKDWQLLPVSPPALQNIPRSALLYFIHHTWNPTSSPLGQGETRPFLGIFNYQTPLAKTQAALQRHPGRHQSCTVTDQPKMVLWNCPKETCGVPYVGSAHLQDTRNRTQRRELSTTGAEQCKASSPCSTPTAQWPSGSHTSSLLLWPSGSYTSSLLL